MGNWRLCSNFNHLGPEVAHLQIFYIVRWAATLVTFWSQPDATFLGSGRKISSNGKLWKMSERSPLSLQLNAALWASRTHTLRLIPGAGRTSLDSGIGKHASSFPQFSLILTKQNSFLGGFGASTSHTTMHFFLFSFCLSFFSSSPPRFPQHQNESTLRAAASLFRRCRSPPRLSDPLIRRRALAFCFLWGYMFTSPTSRFARRL